MITKETSLKDLQRLNNKLEIVSNFIHFQNECIVRDYPSIVICKQEAVLCKEYHGDIDSILDTIDFTIHDESLIEIRRSVIDIINYNHLELDTIEMAVNIGNQKDFFDDSEEFIVYIKYDSTTGYEYSIVSTVNEHYYQSDSLVDGLNSDIMNVVSIKDIINKLVLNLSLRV